MARNGYKRISTKEDKEIVSFVSLLFFQWMNSIFKIGSKRPLDENDFLPLSKENSASFLTDQLQANWNKERANQTRPKLWKSVIKLISVKDAMIIGFTNALYSISLLLQPLLLGYLISILMSAEPKKNNLLYGCILALCINSFIGALGMHHSAYRCELLGIQISCALKGLVYHKVSTNSLDQRLRCHLFSTKKSTANPNKCNANVTQSNARSSSYNPGHKYWDSLWQMTSQAASIKTKTA